MRRILRPRRTPLAQWRNLKKLQMDMERWPKSWAGFDSDVPTGKGIVKVMIPFALAMVEEHLAHTTINRHMGNLWLLGGEIIYRVQFDTEMGKLTGRELVMRFVNEEGGPISRHLASGDEQKKFDATCKKFYRFMILKPG